MPRKGKPRKRIDNISLLEDIVRVGLHVPKYTILDEEDNGKLKNRVYINGKYTKLEKIKVTLNEQTNTRTIRIKKKKPAKE